MSAGIDLLALLQAWDGDLRGLHDVAAALPPTSQVAARLVRLSATEAAPVPVAATWILKHWLEAGMALNRRSAGRIAALLRRPLPWQAQLHLLQMLPRLDLTDRAWTALRPRLDPLLASPRPFVRAWAYNALGLLAARDPALRSTVERVFDDALVQEPPSVRARIRHARKGW